MQCHIFVSLVTPGFFEKKAPNFLDFVMTLVNLEPDCSLKKYQRFYTTTRLPTILIKHCLQYLHYLSQSLAALLPPLICHVDGLQFGLSSSFSCQTWFFSPSFPLWVPVQGG